MSKMVKSYLSMGSNIGNKLYYLMEALIMIDGISEVKLTKVSSFYETAPWGYTDQDSFYNIAAEVETSLLPMELLKKLQDVENKLQRRREVRWGPRTIDIDIIFYDDLKVETGSLILPHPRYRERKFVLAPLYEVYNKREELLKYIRDDRSEIEKIMPNILISSCLLGRECTYRGDSNKKWIFDVIDKVRYVEVCPEVEGGLSTPRTPAERLDEAVITRDGLDVTEEFLRGAHAALDIAKENQCSVAVLKAKSPSCGKGYIYDGTFSGKLTKGMGVTTELLEKNDIKVIAV